MEALRRGARVTLVYGRGVVPSPTRVRVMRVETTEEMYNATLEKLKREKYDVVIAAAAAADFAPEKPAERKIPTQTTSELLLRLKPTLKIVEAVKKVSPNTFLVAFKAEYKVSDEQLIESAYQTLKEANADLIVANDVGRPGAGFEVETNEVFIVDGNKKVIHVPLTTKREVAKKLIDVVTQNLSRCQ